MSKEAPDANVIAQIVTMHRRDAGIAHRDSSSPYEAWKMGGPWMDPSFCAVHFNMFRASGGHICVAKRDQVVVGEIEFRSVQDDEVIFISSLMVDEPHRGEGIGRRLISQTVNYAMSVAARKISVVPDDEARAFYTRMGFALSERRFAITGDASSTPLIELDRIADECRLEDLRSVTDITLGSLQPKEQEIYSLLLVEHLHGLPANVTPRLWKLKHAETWIGVRPAASAGGYARIIGAGPIETGTIDVVAPLVCHAAGQLRWRTYVLERNLSQASPMIEGHAEIWTRHVIGDQ